MLIRNVIIIIIDIITVYNYNYRLDQCNFQANKDFGAARSSPQAGIICICVFNCSNGLGTLFSKGNFKI